MIRSKRRISMCMPLPWRNLREQKTQSNGHLEVNSIHSTRGVGACGIALCGGRRQRRGAFRVLFIRPS